MDHIVLACSEFFSAGSNVDTTIEAGAYTELPPASFKAVGCAGTFTDAHCLLMLIWRFRA